MKLKRKALFFTTISAIFSIISFQNVKAVGNGKVTLAGPDSVDVGSTMKVTLNTEGFDEKEYSNYQIFMRYPKDNLKLKSEKNEDTEELEVVKEINTNVLGPDVTVSHVEDRGLIILTAARVQSKNLNAKAAATMEFEVNNADARDLKIEFLDKNDGVTDENGACITQFFKSLSDGNPGAEVQVELNDHEFTTRIPQYEVKFIDWDGKEWKTVSVESGGSAQAPENPTREGYTFKGWDKTFDNVTSDMTVTATYEANENTLTFAANGGTGEMTAQEIKTDEKVKLPSNGFERAGYDFKGWSETATGEVKYADAAEYTMGTKDATLYAVWGIKSYGLNVEVKGNGVVDPSTGNANHNSSQEFTIKPEVNHYLESVILDGKDITSELKAEEDGAYKYKIENITSEKKLEVVFVGEEFNKKDEKTKVWLEAGEGVFPRGAQLVVNNLNEQQSMGDLNESIDEQIKSIIERITAYDISVKDEKGETIQPETKFGKVTVRIPVPESFDFTTEDLIAYRVNEGLADDIKYEGKLVTLDGQKYYEFEVDHFSDYIVVDKDLDKIDAEDDETSNDQTDDQTNGQINDQTNDVTKPDNNNSNANTDSEAKQSTNSFAGNSVETGETNLAVILFGIMMLLSFIPVIFKKKRSIFDK